LSRYTFRYGPLRALRPVRKLNLPEATTGYHGLPSGYRED